MHSDWLTTGQAARLLGKSRSAVLWYIHLRILPASRITPGGRWRIGRDDLEQFREWARQWQY